MIQHEERLWSVERLVKFERGIADEFNAGKIPYPIHLSGGNEQQLIDVFKDIAPTDYVAGSWRMHYQCLLHGVSPEKLRAAIRAGHSITLCFPEHKIVSSAIVGGILPIALGIAWQIRRSGGSERVHCFMGDMTAETGLAWECVRYAANFHLPVHWIIEDNGKSVCSDTGEVWGKGVAGFNREDIRDWPGVEYFAYDLTWPHSGAGRRVEF